MTQSPKTKLVQNAQIYLSFLSTYSDKISTPQNFVNTIYNGVVRRLGYNPAFELCVMSYPQKFLKDSEINFIPVDVLVLPKISLDNFPKLLGRVLFPGHSLIYYDALKEIAETGICTKIYGPDIAQDFTRLPAHSAVYFETVDTDTGMTELNVLRCLPEEPFILKYYDDALCKKEGINGENFYKPFLPKLMYGNTRGFHTAYNKILCKQLLVGMDRRLKMGGAQVGHSMGITNREYEKGQMLKIDAAVPLSHGCVQLEMSTSVDMLSKEESPVMIKRNPFSEQKEALKLFKIVGTRNLSPGDLIFTGKP